jgi:lysine 2,3-aminomutase
MSDRSATPSRAVLRRLPDLARAGLISPEQAARLRAVAERYAIAVTPEMADLMRAGGDASTPVDPDDPIARQFLPDRRELLETPGESADPIGDARFSPVPGIVHRYADRVLLKLTHLCPVYCRFCFRRSMVGPQHEGLSAAELDRALAYIAQTPTVWEVILTGGDPLILSPRRLADTMERLNAIDHLGVVRIHTRVPVADPDRIDEAMAQALRGARIPTWIAIHCNHWRELTPKARAALARLADGGIPLLGQTALLKGVNDDPETLTATFRAMVSARIKPYYLHHPDMAQGSRHFRVRLSQGQGLLRRLRGAVSGLCQPTYVLDLPGGHGKIPVGPSYLDEGADDGAWRAQDPQGAWHLYHDDVEADPTLSLP